ARHDARGGDDDVLATADHLSRAVSPVDTHARGADALVRSATYARPRDAAGDHLRRHFARCLVRLARTFEAPAIPKRCSASCSTTNTAHSPVTLLSRHHLEAQPHRIRR